MIVGSRCDTGTQQIAVVVHCLNRIDKKRQELQIAFRAIAWCEHIYPGISDNTPVVVLSASIDSFVRFFMKQNAQLMI